MWLKLILVSVLALSWSSIVSPVAGQKLVCYFGSWAVYRPGEGKFDVEDIDPNICTHIVFGFIGLREDGNVNVLDSWNEVDKSAFKRFTCLKKVNPDLKTIVAIGGWNEGSTKYSNVARDANRRRTFVNSAISLIETYGFDGFDLDWEYPAQRGGAPEDVENFVTLVSEFRTEFDKRGLLLTAAVAACEASASLSYKVKEISQLFDFINVMTYDMHGAWDNVTGHNAPLYNSPDGFNVDECISFWLREAPSEKLNLGIGLYGRTFTLKDPNNNGIGAPVSGGGAAGPYTRESGYLGYNEICVNNWPRQFDESQQVSYAFKGNQWVGYDDPESIAVKIEYAKNKNLGGAMVWSLETDDFRNNCKQGRNPLLNAIRTGLGLKPSFGDGKSSPCACLININWNNPGTCIGDPVNNPGNPNNPSNPVNPPEPNDVCSSVGYVRDRINCAVFYYCEIVGSSWKVSTFQCQSGLWYDPVSKICNWPQGECGGGEESSEEDDGNQNSGDENPGGTNPGDTNPGDTNPGDTNPGDTNPGETNPGEGGGDEKDPEDSNEQPKPGDGPGDQPKPLCTAPGVVRDPDNCAVFHTCVQNGASWIVYTTNCPGELLYDTTTGNCNWPALVSC